MTDPSATDPAETDPTATGSGTSHPAIDPDTVARAAGLTLDHRWADWDRTPFTPDAPSHVSVYRYP